MWRTTEEMPMPKDFQLCTDAISSSAAEGSAVNLATVFCSNKVRPNKKNWGRRWQWRLGFIFLPVGNHRRIVGNHRGNSTH
jgi:hypothetical protein